MTIICDIFVGGPFGGGGVGNLGRLRPWEDSDPPSVGFGAADSLTGLPYHEAATPPPPSRWGEG